MWNRSKSEVMNGPTILLLLGCGAIVIAAIPMRNANANAKSKIFNHRLQNINSNVNTNIFGNGPRPRQDYDIDEPDPILRNMGRRLYSESNPELAAKALAAARAALSIMRTLVVEFSRTAAVEIADAVSKIITNQSQTAEEGRRNYNVNTNVNTNILGGGRHRERTEARDLLDENESHREVPADLPDDNPGSGSNDLDLGSAHDLLFGTMKYGLPNGYITDIGDKSGGLIFDEAHDALIKHLLSFQDRSEEEEEDEKVTSRERLVDIDDEEADSIIDSPASRTLGSRRRSRQNQGNFNFNTNTNHLNPRYYPNAADNKYLPDLRSSAYRRSNNNANSNSNNFRRNMNSNSNFNTNTNTNNQRFRTRRE